MKIYPGLMVLAGIITQVIGYIAPVQPILSETWQYIGIALMVLGFASIFLAARSFRKYETTIIPDGQPSTLMEGALFAYSRNPIYVAMALLLIGSGLAIGHIWALIVVPLLCCWCSKSGLSLKKKISKPSLGKFTAIIKCVRRWL